MKILFYLAGGLLAISGLMHLVLVFTTPGSATLPTVSTVIFAIADMALGVMIVRRVDKVLPYGVAIPFIGGLLTLVTMNTTSTSWHIGFMVVDVLVIACCLFLMRAGGPVIDRVK